MIFGRNWNYAQQFIDHLKGEVQELRQQVRDLQGLAFRIGSTHTEPTVGEAVPVAWPTFPADVQQAIDLRSQGDPEIRRLLNQYAERVLGPEPSDDRIALTVQGIMQGADVPE